MMEFKHRPLFFVLNGNPSELNNKKHYFDIDLDEMWVDTKGKTQVDLRAYIIHIEGTLTAHIFKHTSEGDTMKDAMVFPKGTTLVEATQWLWVQLAIFNEDDGIKDADREQEDT